MSNLRRIDAYWFGAGSPVALGLFRIVYGLLAFLSLSMLLPFWQEWFGPNGFVPPEIGSRWVGGRLPLDFGYWESGLTVPRLSLIGGVTHPGVVLGFLIVTWLAAGCLALGLFTRVAGWIFALGIVSLHHRNIGYLNGGDTVLRVLSVVLAVSPCGEACSLDRLRKLWSGSALADRIPRPSVWAQRVITYEVALLYFTTVWCKWFGNTWMQGTATWYPPRLQEMQRVPMPGFMNEFPIVTVTTYGTLLVEFLLATLVFYRPWRKWILIAGLAMHAYIDVSMNIPLFSWITVSMYLCFFDGEEVTAWARKVGDRYPNRRVTLSLPTHTPDEVIQLITGSDPFGWVTIHRIEGPTAATRTNGETVEWTHAVTSACAGLWVLWPFHRIIRRQLAQRLAIAS